MSNENGCHFAANSVWTEGQHGTLHLADVDSKEVPDHERPETPAPTTQYHRQTIRQDGEHIIPIVYDLFFHTKHPQYRFSIKILHCHDQV